MARSVSIRRSLLVNLLVGTLALGGGILATTFLGVRRAVRTLSRDLITSSIENIDARLHGFFDPIADELRGASGWGEQGLLDPSGTEGLNRLFVPLLASRSQVSSVMIADERGREHMLLRDGSRWRSRQTRREEWGDRVELLAWSDDAPEPVASTEDLEYDPRARPWFVAAIAGRRGTTRAGVHWTEPYEFFTTRRPGITASMSFTGPDGRPGVIAYDVTLADLTTFTERLRVGREGFVFVLSDDYRLIALPAARLWANTDAQRSDAVLQLPRTIGLALLNDAAMALRGSDLLEEPVRFRSEGRVWWGAVRPFVLSPDRRLWAAVVVPESDLLGSLVIQRAVMGSILFVVLGVAILRALVLARRYSRPIEMLEQQSDRISRGDLARPDPVISNVAEVQRLAAAHERMREGLRSLMKLERDLQLARLIQQKTFPSVLPALPGFEIDAYSEPAEETGGDTYDVIGFVRDTVVAGSADEAARRLSTSGASHAMLLLADATGHGIGPALSVTQVRAMLRMAVRMRADLPGIARQMNEELQQDLPDGRFITAWLGELDGVAGTVTSVSCGQAPLIRYDAARDAFCLIPADVVPLGVIPDIRLETPRPIQLAPGDLFVVLSDGIFEAMDPEGEQFGKDRVLAVLREHRDEPPGAMLAALRRAVGTFTNGARADDDRTAILVKRL